MAPSHLVNLALLVVGTTADGHTDCPCIASGPAQVGTSGHSWVTGQYGYTCIAHDDGNGDCAAATADELKDGGSKDWCKDKWCIVDPNNCKMRTRAVGYTTNATDMFSYETCGTTAAPFTGNSWTGTVKCSWDQTSYCTADENGKTTCKCKGPAKSQTATAGNTDATFVTGTEYGFGCMTHDHGKGSCASATADELKDGGAKDWCKDKWCIVDTSTCEFGTRSVGYTADTSDYFSYETCGTTAAPFAGNSWTGTVACSDKPTSFCKAADNTAMAGSTGCPCVLPGKTQTAATDKPAFVTGTTYGYGCKLHDKGKATCVKPANETKDGAAFDWCLDKYCIVDPNNCDLKTRGVTYTANTTDMFSYETCDANFKGNAWVGTTKCADNAKSYCKAVTNTDTSIRMTASALVGLVAAAVAV